MLIKKYDFKKDRRLAEELPFSYFSSPVHLDHFAYVLQLGEDKKVLVWQDLLFPQSFPCIFLPKDSALWKNLAVTLVTGEEREHLLSLGKEFILDKPLDSEYFYKTEDFIFPKNDFGRRVRQFESTYKFKVLSKYSSSDIAAFYEKWKDQRSRDSIGLGSAETFFYFCLKNLDKYNIRQVYIEIDGKLEGLAWGVAHSKDKWIGLELKVSYGVKGISHYLHHKRAELFAGTSEFSLGNGIDKGIATYKDELGPAYKRPYFYLLIGS
jgi:hypothetical protein